MYAPLTEEKLSREFCKAFNELTGTTLRTVDTYVSKHSHGGMSSGMICSVFWSETALPMLIKRLNEINNR